MADMSREEAAQYLAWMQKLYPGAEITIEQEEIDAIKVAITALRGPVPDPETGLVPCGCGGKASFYYWDARVQAVCEECSMETAHLLSCDEARDEWNISHGYKGDA